MIVLGVTSTTDMGDFTEVRKGMQAELQTERIFLIFQWMANFNHLANL